MSLLWHYENFGLFRIACPFFLKLYTNPLKLTQNSYTTGDINKANTNKPIGASTKAVFAATYHKNFG